MTEDAIAVLGIDGRVRIAQAGETIGGEMIPGREPPQWIWGTRDTSGTVRDG